MQLRPGMRLVSAVCDAQVVVIKAPSGDVEVGCGGAPMLVEEPDRLSRTEDSSLGEGPALGKRYADDDVGIELLCSRAGTGALSLNGDSLAPKDAKPLPSSD